MNLQTLKWGSIPSLNYPRVQPAAAILDSEVYVIGGEHNNSIEKFIGDQW